VVDGRMHLPLTSQLVITAGSIPTWLVTLPGGDGHRRDAYAACGLEVIEVEEGQDGNIDMGQALAQLGDRGVTRVLVEGGSRVVASLLRSDMVDRIAWFRAPRLIGGDGIPAVAPLGVDLLFDTPSFIRTGVMDAGGDLLETYTRKP
jgi:diaminohydroxyphosphoribosylaminopyrimidine deaminase/5-amino-6-(5-phosphoribosylamino)uracil reductase